MKLVIIHTTPVTISSLKELSKEFLPNVEVVNILDDSILPDMNGGKSDGVRERWLKYAEIASSLGADIILSACSTVGEFASQANETLDTPVIRIDEEMVGRAIDRGGNILVLATLPSTLSPTVKLLESIADEKKAEVNITPFLVEGAFQFVSNGDKEAHDRLIRRAIEDFGSEANTIVLAQASMAGAVASMAEEVRNKVLTSPRPCFEKLKEMLSI